MSLGYLKKIQVFASLLSKWLMKFVHCLAEGFKEAADKFRVESGIEPCSDLSMLDDRIKVREAVLSGNIQSAIGLVNDLYPELLDNDRLLCFHLQVD